MADCLHLKSCRRLCKISESNNNKKLVRGCNENCSAYVSEQEIRDIFNAMKERLPSTLTDSGGYRWFIDDAIENLKESVIAEITE